MRPKHIPTLKDVACQSGTSITTVSHVLHGKSHLYADLTVKRVLEAASALKYHPNSLARNLVQRCSHTLGAVILRTCGDGFDRQLFSILSGIFEHAAQYGYQVKLIPWELSTWETVVPHLEDASIDGVLLFLSEDSAPLVTWAYTTDLPSVSIGSLPKGMPLSCVDVDNETALYDATSRLIALGHRRIGYIRGPACHPSTLVREAGYRRALYEASITPDPAWLCDGNFAWEAGMNGMHCLLDIYPTITALLCPSDLAAMGAMAALHLCGRRVPDDVSVIGFNESEFAQFTRPPLTTIHTPMAEIGQKAVELLIRQIEGKEEEGKPECVLLPASLLSRASVAPMLCARQMKRLLRQEAHHVR